MSDPAEERREQALGLALQIKIVRSGITCLPPTLNEIIAAAGRFDRFLKGEPDETSEEAPR